ncbi:MCE family protein [Actinomadura sp. DC4]|uniref:MCE family protein n=1 Tax=Actinomadura sp. DC4 TaxID=3055069 RepID=UPI0025B0EB7F|nr:MCE family protein [Actinomadura sp. DC4]MDN3357842.1 MCE family protein [Actinomadura sp. DC4]
MRAVRPAALAVVSMTLAGCGSGGFGGVYGVPLPGGADLGDHPYKVTAEFANVHDLVPQAAVKVNDVAVGRVSTITLPRNGWTASVVMQVNGKVHLPADAYAQLAQSSLLGEKYIQLSAPAGGGQGTLADGSMIPMSRTNRDPEVEEVFGALSLLLNGGGIAQLRTITSELNKALGGNEPQIRQMLGRVDTLVSDLNGHRKDITDAIDGLDRLSATLASRKRQIGVVLDDLGPGLKILEEQRGSLVTMLRALENLSGVAVSTINKSKADMVADLQSLAPVLGNLADAGRDLPQSLQVLLTYPFTDEVLKGIKGDYLNIYLSVTAVPGTTVIPPLTPPADLTAARRNPKAAPMPFPLPPVGGVSSTPTAGTTLPGSPPPGSTGSPPGSTPPGSAPPASSPPGSVPPAVSPTATPSVSNGGG